MNPRLRQGLHMHKGCATRASQSGSILLDALMSLLLGAIVIGSAAASFSNTWARSTELRVKSQVHTEARILLDMLAFDLRMAGSGLPLGQTTFSTALSSRGEEELPIYSGATSSNVTVQLNELGTTAVLTSAFTPSANSRTMQTSTTAGFSVGDTVYVSDMPSRGTTALRGTIEAITTGSITIASSYTSSRSVSFPAGSTIEPVTRVTYANSSAGITRDSGAGAVLLAPHSSFSITYLDSSGTALATPLSSADINNVIRAVRLQVHLHTTSGTGTLSNQTFSATTSQTVALRNVNLNR